MSRFNRLPDFVRDRYIAERIELDRIAERNRRAARAEERRKVAWLRPRPLSRDKGR